MQNKKVSFHYIDVKFFFKNRETVKQFILELFKREGKKVDTVNYIFCTDEYLIDLNMEYLNHDTYTDIITFFYSSMESDFSKWRGRFGRAITDEEYQKMITLFPKITHMEILSNELTIEVK